LNKWNWKNK